MKLNLNRVDADFIPGDTSTDLGWHSETRRRTPLVLCGLLILTVAAVFGQTVAHDFVDFDDGDYVRQNRHVVEGLSRDAVLWAFTQFHAANWHPLTWLSHMADCQFFGLWAGGHHLTSVACHAVNAVVLFLVLRRMTGDLWPSAWVAAVFAVHPQHVESVAWVAERKDVLSGLFFMLTLAVYAGYAGRPFSVVRYLAVTAVFAAGLLCKPMLVTLPCVLLLLDYWPLGRLDAMRAKTTVPANDTALASRRWAMRWWLEKLPWLAMAGVSCIVTVLAQRSVMASEESLSGMQRLGNAVVSYVAYLGQFLFPTGMSVLYLHPGDVPEWKVLGSLVILAAISLGAAACWRRRPYVLVGWLWYLGMLVPVIGLIQVGRQAMADRYMYLPQIGLLVILAWGVKDLMAAWSMRPRIVAAVAAVALVVLTACAWRQTGHWRDSEALWRHALACDPRNHVAWNNLGNVHTDRDEIDRAMTCFREAVAVQPGYGAGRYGLGSILHRRGEIDEAIREYQQAIQCDPKLAGAYNNLGAILADRGHAAAAIAYYEKALGLEPEHADANSNLGQIRAKQKRFDEARALFRKAIGVKPDDASIRNKFGVALYWEGRLDEAIEQYQASLAVKPGFAPAHYNWGNALAAREQFTEAAGHYEKALEFQPDHLAAHINLGSVLAGMHRYGEAAEHFRKALVLQPGNASAQKNLDLALRKLREEQESDGRKQGSGEAGEQGK